MYSVRIWKVHKFKWEFTLRRMSSDVFCKEPHRRTCQQKPNWMLTICLGSVINFRYQTRSRSCLHSHPGPLFLLSVLTLILISMTRTNIFLWYLCIYMTRRYVGGITGFDACCLGYYVYQKRNWLLFFCVLSAVLCCSVIRVLMTPDLVYAQQGATVHALRRKVTHFVLQCDDYDIILRPICI